MNPTSRPRVIDSATTRMREFASSVNWRRIALESALGLLDEIRSKVSAVTGELQGEYAADYLATLVPLAERAILDHHRAYGSVRWLWYLRRAPDELFSGDHGTTLGYDRTLAEALSWYQAPVDTMSHPTSVVFDTNIASFRHLARLIGRLKLLSQLHQWYRRIGKGAILDMSSRHAASHISEALDAAIRSYDTRNDRSHEVSWSGLGLAAVDPDTRLLNEMVGQQASTLCMTFHMSGSLWMPANYPDGKGGYSLAEVEGRHFLRLTKVQRILDPLSQGTEAKPPYLQEVASLIQLLLMVPAFFGRFPWALISTVQQGYFFVVNSALRSACNDYLPDLAAELTRSAPQVCWPDTYEAWKQQTDAIIPSLWPLRSGGVLRSLGPSTLVDITSASQALLQRVEFDRSPLLGNDRANAFELQCQEIIHESTWRPSVSLSGYRGRTLRRGGVALTDVDAIGSNKRTVLLISCKSLIYDREYDKGTFRVVRNTQTTVDKAVLDWSEVIAQLRLQPIGDNFDLSEFDAIIGVVCTPFIVYSSHPATLRFVADGLHACASALELRDWLRKLPL